MMYVYINIYINLRHKKNGEKKTSQNTSDIMAVFTSEFIPEAAPQGMSHCPGNVGGADLHLKSFVKSPLNAGWVACWVAAFW